MEWNLIYYGARDWKYRLFVFLYFENVSNMSAM